MKTKSEKNFLRSANALETLNDNELSDVSGGQGNTKKGSSATIFKTFIGSHFPKTPIYSS